MKLSGCLYFENTRKNFKLNLVHVVVLFLESKGLYCDKYIFYSIVQVLIIK